MANSLSHVVRRKFVDYFVTKRNHQFIKSSSVLPKHDKSLSFVNAGMNQFKPLFLQDLDHYSPNRVCNYQKCIRVGGKMCDLDVIGRDFRHHTFFEMLGNWSFNDYGKQEACEWALDFLVNHLDIDINRLRFTYYSSNEEVDLETKEIWRKMGVQEERILENNTGDNFWEMGSSGPCGVSTEIFYKIKPDQADGDENLLEIWNLVFIDRQRLEDNSKIVPLKNKFVDTGMGLERILSVLENVESNYDTDLFKSLFKVIESKSEVAPYQGSLSNELDINYRILADHARMTTIALSDGIEGGRRGSSFDLRKIIRKCLLLSGKTFHQKEPRLLLFDLVDEIIDILSPAYPELPKSVSSIRRSIARESKRYLAYLEKSQTN